MKGFILNRSFGILIVSLLVFASCRNKSIPGPYYIDPDNSLNYDLGTGGIGRINMMSHVAWTDKYILAISEGKYYWLDKTKDSLYYNYDEIVNGPLKYNEFKKVLDSLGIREIKYAIDLTE